jgi:hypothetical protein
MKSSQTARPPAPPVDAAALEQSGPAFAPTVAACPRCAYPVRRVYAGELICPNCGHREPQSEALRALLKRMVNGE